MNIRHITIEREYGSGGTLIARRLAEETGASCYGREILEAVSAKQNISVEDIEKYEESATNSFLYSLYIMGQAHSGNADMLSIEGHVFVAEQAEIQRFSKNGKSIFLGHCASYALKEQDGVLRVFIRCTDDAAKKSRIVNEYGVSPTMADVTRKRFDKKRANYFYANTGKKWDDLKNYDIVLDSGVLGIESCVDILKALFCKW